MYTQGDFVLDNRDFFEIIFCDNITNGEFSLKFYDVEGQHISLQLADGFHFKFNDLKTILGENFVLDFVTLMYRQSNAPKTVKLNTTVTYSAVDEFYFKNELPTPLHSNDAIVTEL